jgi:hypothetical protein
MFAHLSAAVQALIAAEQENYQAGIHLPGARHAEVNRLREERINEVYKCALVIRRGVSDVRWSPETVETRLNALARACCELALWERDCPRIGPAHLNLDEPGLGAVNLDPTGFAEGVLDDHIEMVQRALRAVLSMAEPPPVEVVPVCSIRLVGAVWTIHYQGELGEYPARDHKCLGWLAKVLGRPGHQHTVAELRGDSEGRLKADSSPKEEAEADPTGLQKMYLRVEDLDEMIRTGGGNVELETERAYLVKRLEEGYRKHKLSSPHIKAHHTVASQLRKFRREKLAEEMPRLAAHLHVCLDLAFPHITYSPPAGHPTWAT